MMVNTPESLARERKELLRRFSTGELKSYEVRPLLDDLDERARKLEKANRRRKT